MSASARWAAALAKPAFAAGYQRAAHLARADIHESIAELRHYRARIFVTAT